MADIQIGELLPWKGVWWEVVDFNEQLRRLTLIEKKPTDYTLRVEARTARWLKQHPKALKPKGV